MVASLDQVAFHHLATTAESLSYMPATGFSVAATTLIGQLWSREKEMRRILVKFVLYYRFVLDFLVDLCYISSQNN